MADPIKPGDRVIVVKSCCQGRILPMVFDVMQIGIPKLFATHKTRLCHYCKKEMVEQAFVYPTDPKFIAQPLAWVRKIYPLDALEGMKTQEPIRAPIKV